MASAASHKPDCDNATYIGYGGESTSIPGSCHSHGGGLPFTGFDIGLMVLVALVIIALGFLLRHVNRTT